MRVALILACAAVALAGCATAGGKAASEPPSVTIKALADVGCKIQFSVGFGGATGQLGGGLHAENSFSGSCDPTLVHPLSAAGVAAALAEAGKP